MRGQLLGTVAGLAATVAGVAVAVTMLDTPSLPLASLPRPHISVTAGNISVADLKSYHWDRLPNAPIAVRDAGVVSVWTGSQMIVWGGVRQSDGHVFGDGASYDPATRAWITMPPSPLRPRASAAFAWTGQQLFIWGGASHLARGLPNVADDGALYDPATRTWHQLPKVSVGLHALAEAVWTGTRVVLFTAAAASHGDTDTAEVHAYDPSTDSWSTLPSIHVPQTQLLGIVPLVAGDQLYVFMPVETVGSGVQTSNDSFVYRPATNTWAESRMLPASGGYAIGNTEWTGDHIIFGPAGVACSMCSGHPGQSSGSWADLRTGTVQPIATWHREPPFSESSLSWTGAAVLALGGDRDAGAWDPASDTWTQLARPPYQGEVVQVWTGAELLIWGQLYQRPSTDPNAGTPQPVKEPTGLEFAPNDQ